MKEFSAFLCDHRVLCGMLSMEGSMLRAKIEIWIIIIITVLGVHGCAVSTQDVTPEVLSTHGLLVGRYEVVEPGHHV